MSKGMKQKTALVVGFMADKDIIILDEPTTGLDPLMREEFLEIIKEEKAKGKTILMSSQSFDELEAVCDRVGMIYNGHLIDVVDIATIGKPDKNTYKIEFLSEGDYKKFLKLGYNVIRTQENFNQVTVEISKSEISKMFESLSELKIKFISQIKYNLERHFKEVLSRVKEDKNV
jgi:ABC-2 type transport system ATP-binding protein